MTLKVKVAEDRSEEKKKKLDAYTRRDERAMAEEID